ncbi:polar amino acid transport system substrate-binding protein [Paucibacter oligotrophus]|uniref:Polar amino acid transport system substrate-binding protein n=1 Tax=Roseateles oligotrophus TaxID=1769250 RepID=A0A840L8U4_9BURK|nr:transporter substrate-binding domain-containing protein [Roseateles oligotrophus]MBB4844181.1 polar amino acid transport system substrate-binding protein [Roseateles oligotrophus]
MGAYSLLGLLPQSARAQPLMRISTLLEGDPATLIAERVMREAYLRLGIALEVQAMPGERSLISANSGETDGELYRKMGIDKSYPQLIRVPVPLQTYEIVVFTKLEPFKVEGWESLRPYKIGFVKGIKIIEEKTLGMQAESVATMHQAFTKLDRGRSELVLANRVTGLASLRAHQFQGVKVLLPPLASFFVYHYLNKKHAALVPKLSEVLKHMEQERTLQRIKEDVLAGF